MALSMLITPFLFLSDDALALETNDFILGVESADEIDKQGPVIIADVGHFGQIVNHLVRNSGIKTVVFNDNLKPIQLMRPFGFKGFFCRSDATRASPCCRARYRARAYGHG